MLVRPVRQHVHVHVTRLTALLRRRQPGQRSERHLLLESMGLLHERSPRGVSLQGMLQQTSGLVLDVIQPDGGRILVAKEVDATVQIRPLIAYRWKSRNRLPPRRFQQRK